MNQNKKYTQSIGLKVHIHNQSYAPSSSEALSIEMGKETNIGMKRTFSYKYPYPYSDCIDLSKLNSEIESENFRYIKYTQKKPYRKYDCFKFCLQRMIINACECFWTRYSKLKAIRPCSTIIDLKCVYKQQIDFDQEQCSKECPLECQSVFYDYAISSMDFPARSMYDEINESDLAKMNVGSFGIDL